MLFEHEQQLNRIEQKVDAIMAGQASIDAAVTAINSFLTDLSADVTAIKAEIDAGGTVSTDALDAAVAQLPAAQAAIDALAHPAPPTSASASAATVTQTNYRGL
jgi:hypothetical protein